MKKNTSAFPFEQTGSIATQKDTGMTLRDYFAAKVMQGMNPDEWTCIDELSKKSYQIADAMLKQREL